MSIAQVSRLAGVSMATVSRVINRHPQVSAQNIEAVRSAIAKVGYTPPPRERRIGRPRRTPLPERSASLHPERAGSIALLFEDTSQSAMRTRLTSRLMHGVEESLWQQSLTMTVTRLPRSGEVPSALNARTVDGLITRVAYGEVELPEVLRLLPCVHLFEERQIPAWGDCVLEDNPAIGALAAEYLINLGCRDFAFVNPIANHPSLKSRGSAFRDSAERHNVRRVRKLAKDSDSADIPEWLAAMVDQLIAEGPPDSLFVPGHDSGVQVLIEALARRGLVPGRDLQLVCCHNDVPVIQGIAPGAAVIDICPEAMGEAAVETLLWRLDHPGSARRRVLISPVLVRGKSNGSKDPA